MKIVLLLVFIISTAGCNLTIGTGYTKGYALSGHEAAITGVIEGRQTFHETSSGKLEGYIRHESDIFEQSDNDNGLNSVGVSMTIKGLL